MDKVIIDMQIVQDIYYNVLSGGTIQELKHNLRLNLQVILGGIQVVVRNIHQINQLIEIIILGGEVVIQMIQENIIKEY